MKKVIVFFSISMLVLCVSGCNKNVQDHAPELVSIVGTDDFLSAIQSMDCSLTKTGAVSENEITDIISPLFPVAIEFLSSNGYNYEEDFQDDDPNIILTALVLLEYDIRQSPVMTKGAITDVLSCTLFGVEAGTLAGLGTKKLAKFIAKKLLARAVPYVGTAVTVASAAVCIADL